MYEVYIRAAAQLQASSEHSACSGDPMRLLKPRQIVHRSPGGGSAMQCCLAWSGGRHGLEHKLRCASLPALVRQRTRQNRKGTKIGCRGYRHHSRVVGQASHAVSSS